MYPTAAAIGVPLERQDTQMQVFSLLASGTARSRSELSRILGIAPSTVSLHVAALLDSGLISERGDGESTGGRKPRVLEVAPDGGHVLVGDLGGTHARIGIVDLTGELRHTIEIPLDVAMGPEAALVMLAATMRQSAIDWRVTSPLRGVCIALPGPVDINTGAPKSPARMPGWNAFPVRDWLAAEFNVPAAVDNDANLMALGEHIVSAPGRTHSITVKTGTGLGSGIVVDGRLYRGATSAAGDITHVRVAAAGARPCSCGNLGCLETIASGAAIIRDLRAAGRDASSIRGVIALIMDGDPLPTTLVRTAGHHLGEVLGTVVNFFNPSAVFLGGALSSIEPFVAAVRSQLYESCHPLATQSLTIAQLRTGHDAGLLGAGRLILDEVLLGQPSLRH